MIKVKIENPTSNRFAVRFPGANVDIPPFVMGEDAVFFDLPQLPVVEKWLKDLTARHRAVKASIVGVDYEGDAEVSPSDSVDQQEPEKDNEQTAEEKEKEAAAFEAFTNKVASAKEAGGGWWKVDIGEKKPISVRGCEDESEAIFEAFEKYMKENN